MRLTRPTNPEEGPEQDRLPSKPQKEVAAGCGPGAGGGGDDREAVCHSSLGTPGSVSLERHLQSQVF